MNERKTPAYAITARVSAHSERAPGVFRMDIEAPEIGRVAHPGQFLHVRPSWGLDPILPRPFSIHKILRGSGGVTEGVSILYRVVGRGTRLLAGRKPGDEVQILGPLGNGFDLSPFEGLTYLVAGGMGSAPLLFLGQEGVRGGLLGPESCEVIYGAPTKAELVVEPDFTRLGLPLFTATDDGTAGFHGNALDLLLSRLDVDDGKRRVFAVGPEPMYRDLRNRLAGQDVTVWVSMERRMACGLGVCRSCVLPVRGGGGAGTYRDVCRNGPVFFLDEILFDGMEAND